MDPILESRVRHIFDNANFVRDLGLELTRIEDGACETRLVPAERHQQQHGFVHAAVIAAMADHTAGCAARSAVDVADDVITIEKVTGDAGAKIEFAEVLMIGGGSEAAKLGAPFLSGAKVTATVQSHGQGDKVVIVKFRRRKHYRRGGTHRQQYTEVKVTGIVA